MCVTASTWTCFLGEVNFGPVVWLIDHMRLVLTVPIESPSVVCPPCRDAQE
jgi:hypothetical protein